MQSIKMIVITCTYVKTHQIIYLRSLVLLYVIISQFLKLLWYRIVVKSLYSELKWICAGNASSTTSQTSCLTFLRLSFLSVKYG